MSRYLSHEDETQIVAEYQAGKTAREIARERGRSKTTIINVLRRSGVIVRAPAPRDNHGARNPNWKGGTYRDAAGYVYEWTSGGHRRQHRVRTAAPEGSIVHHRDGNRENNEPDNLEVLPSHSAHRAAHVAEERAKHGIARCPPPLPGEKNPRAKLAAEQVAEIRRLLGSVSQRELARRFGVSKTAIGFIKSGRNWRVREWPEVPRG